MKQLKTLPDDIFHLFDPKLTHVPSEENLEEFARNAKDILRTRLTEREPLDNPLRFSALGKQDRQIWYMSRHTPQEDMTPKTYFKFLYGDIIELLVLFLAKEAGHDVHSEQLEVEVDGVKGHIDAIIDGVVVDVKSAAPYGYQKFKKQEVLEDDPFGYVQQLAGYSNVLNKGNSAAWVAFDKVGGDICISPLSASVIGDYPPEDRITHLKGIIAQKDPPPRCYDDKPDGKSGNMMLPTGCAYCAFKHTCWSGVRTFLYSNGPRYLTRVAKVPDVTEVT